MAKTNNTTSNNPNGATCLNCKRSRLLQYGANPIIAECCAKPQPGNELFPYERFPASTPACHEWKKYEHPHRTKYICVMRPL